MARSSNYQGFLGIGAVADEAYREWEGSDGAAALREQLGELATARHDSTVSRQREVWRATAKAATKAKGVVRSLLEDVDADYAERRPILISGQHCLIGNYGTALNNNYLADNRAQVSPHSPAAPASQRKRSNTEPQAKFNSEPKGDARSLRGDNEYAVKEYDTVGGIALRLEISERDLRRLNRLSRSDSVYAGQRLRLPS